jgi:hypothetical protein
MIARARFRLYRWLLERSAAKDFQTHRVWPLEIPGDDHVDVEPLCEELPQLHRARNYPPTEHADGRLRGHRLRAFGGRFVALIPARRTASIGADLDSFLDEIYTARYRSIWPTPPRTPPELETGDALAALAVSSPFAIYLRHSSALAEPAGVVDLGADDYVIDMRLFDGHEPKPGLLPPGGLAVLTAEGDTLHTRGVWWNGRFHEPDDDTFERASLALRCAMNTHITTLLHNATMHLAYVTPMAVATTNELAGDHPIRRLLHPALQTTLIGNHQLAEFQIVGPRAFATTLFSHDHETTMRIVNEYLDGFVPAHFDPEHDFERRGLASAGLALPSWDDRLALWQIARAYVDAYVAHYYPDDAAVPADEELSRWATTLDDLLPNGLYDEEGYLPRDAPFDRAQLTRICAAFLHTSSVTHDLVNNVVWDYATLNYAFPTQLPESGERQDVRLSFDLMNTYLGTWKPFNMVLDGCSHLALDDTGRELMDGYVDALRARQAEIDVDPSRVGRIEPRNLNPSVSN